MNQEVIQMNDTFPYLASMTREPFLFYEMRATARIYTEGLSDEEIIEKIINENAFQYPTERSLKQIGTGCLKRLHALNNDSLVEVIAHQSVEIAKQACLYAMMRYNRLVWEFMISVIGSKYNAGDRNFSKMDLSVFFMQLQEQNDVVATWSDSTIQKIKQILCRILVECEYLDNIKSETLNPVYLYPELENAIRENGDYIALAAFNCFA